MKETSGARVLVLGGAGFIGSHFVKLLLKTKKHVRVVVFDKLTYSGNLENLQSVARDPRYLFIKGDIAVEAEIASVFNKYQPEYVINFAAETHVDRSIHAGARPFLETNVMGVYEVLEAVRKSKTVKRFLQVSTDEVYGDLPLASKKRFTPDTALAPNSPYASSKAQADLLCRAYFKTFQVPVIVTRCGNNYGPNQYPEKLIPFLIMRIREGKTAPLYGKGENMRDWIHVEDHAQALLLALFKGRPGTVYTVGAGTVKSNYEVALNILRYFGYDSAKIEYVTDRPGHDRKYAIDSTRIEKELGFRPRQSFTKGLEKTIDWYVANRAWLDRIKKRAGSFNSHIA